MPQSPQTVFLSAAETSGDSHGARLIAALRERLGDNTRFVGAAGERMAAAGCEPLVDLTRRASMLLGPVARLPYYWRQVRRLRRAIRDIRPDVHVPIDSPAMNWHLAAESRKCGVPVVYYIAPQVWAWAPWRIRKLRRRTDRVACILPFEQEYFRARGVTARYVGHPLFDGLDARPDPLPDLVDAWTTGRWRVALLAGSREAEIRNHAPALAQVAAAVHDRWPEARCTFTAPSRAAAEAISTCIDPSVGEVDIAVGRTQEVLGGSHFAIAASGTVTLEVAHFGVPMVIFYKAGRLAWHALGRWLIRTPHLSLVNILAGRRVVPELMPWHGDARLLSETTIESMSDLGWLIETRRKLIELTAPLQPPPGRTAAGNAADVVCEMLRR